MTRIIAGRGKGRLLKVPAQGTRPTSDRVRESIFSSLEHAVDGWDGLRVLDLYAGSGAFGLEALSRGAQSATLVERARPAAAVARQNIASTGLAARVANCSVAAFLRAAEHSKFDLVFADPPYEMEDRAVQGMLDLLVGGAWLSDEAIVLVERSKRSAPVSWPAGFGDSAMRRFGDTVMYRAIWYVS